MMKFALVFLLALSGAEASINLCPLVDEILNFIQPGLENYFDSKCVPQLQEQISVCQNPAGEIESLVSGVCSDVTSELVSIAKNIPFIGSSVASLLGNGGFDKMCVTDLEAKLLPEIQTECSTISKLNPTTLCDKAFSEISGILKNFINNHC